MRRTLADNLSGSLQFDWHPNSEPIVGVGDDQSSLKELTVHLFNLENFHGTDRRLSSYGGETISLERIKLEGDGYTVLLNSLESTPQTIQRLKNEGGFGLTHVCRVTRTDSSPISGKEALELLEALDFFFSFAGGGRCSPVCSVGRAMDGTTVWEYWNSPREQWQQRVTWFDPRHGEHLEKLLPGFMAKWQKENWRDALHEAIYWYLQSNNPGRGIDTAIILTQTAIERLSYEYVVREKKLLEINGFKDLRASDKYRILFSSLSIPIDIPVSLPKMGSKARQCHWLDSPQALTEIRNSLVHPEHKRKAALQECIVEAWKFGLWYLELCILRLCDYQGSYSNRLTARYVGQIEDVPWADS